ncbi:hypothetical protein GCM10029978_036780 [Actinoallomurus acanthiterrae]
MPDEGLPDFYVGPPHAELLPPRTVLWRVHRRKRSPLEFKPYDARFAHGRFDGSEDDPYPTMYAAFQQSTAITEVLLRSVPFERREHRILPFAAVRDRDLSALVVTKELRMITLTSTRALAAVCQDEWLIHCEHRAFRRTRNWAGWLRTVAPDAHGIIWTTRRDLPERSALFFGDRCDEKAFGGSGLASVRLDNEEGLSWLNATLDPYRASVGPPDAP